MIDLIKNPYTAHRIAAIKCIKIVQKLKSCVVLGDITLYN